MGICLSAYENAYDDDFSTSADTALLNLSVEGLLADILGGLREGSTLKVVACVGAGISVSAGIPDFRTPGTGLYDNLQKYGLPYAEAVFDINYFRKRPEPFYALAKEMWPDNFRPTVAHHFLRLLQEKQVLRRVYTQNIDTLERSAGISPELLVEAHGSFATASCIGKACRKEKDAALLREAIFARRMPRCEACGSLVKPDIVFFGEGLPKRFFECMSQDLQRDPPDLIIVAGTSLKVQPFAGLPGMSDCPRLLINREVPASFKVSARDATMLGEIDDGFRALAAMLGWQEDLDELAN